MYTPFPRHLWHWFLIPVDQENVLKWRLITCRSILTPNFFYRIQLTQDVFQSICLQPERRHILAPVSDVRKRVIKRGVWRRLQHDGTRHRGGGSVGHRCHGAHRQHFALVRRAALETTEDDVERAPALPLQWVHIHVPLTYHTAPVLPELFIALMYLLLFYLSTFRSGHFTRLRRFMRDKRDNLLFIERSAKESLKWTCKSSISTVSSAMPTFVFAFATYRKQR